MDINDLQLIKIEDIKTREFFTSSEIRTPFLAEVKKQVMSIVPDATTAQGRKDIASVAYKVAKVKTAIEKLCADEVRTLKDLPKKILAGGKEVNEFLQALQDEYRDPLTKYENEEKAKAEAEEVERKIGKDHDEALELNNLFNREREVARKEAELNKLAEEQRARDQAAKDEEARKAREEQIRKEAAEQAEREKAEAEARAKKAEEERIEAEKRAELAKEEAAKQAEQEKKEAVELAERKVREEEAQKESERIAKEEAAKRESEKKAADAEHRAKIKRESCRFIKGIYGTTQEQAEGIFDSISAGSVPHISVNY